MKIGVDCRMYGLKHAGIGRYVMNLVENLILLDRENEYILFCRNEAMQNFENLKLKIENSLKIDNLKLKIILSEFPHYSLAEQIKFPRIIGRENPDIMHFSHFNVPVFYQGKYVVTIHDLIKHTSKGMATTTRSPFLYWPKYFGYKFVFSRAVKRAARIITPSQFVKDEAIKEYRVEPEKVVVTYEGVDDKFKIQNSKFKNKEEFLDKYKIKKPYLLYVGNVYPHKNIEKLIEAVKLINKSNTYHLTPITLVIVCARNVFSERLSKKIEQMEAKDVVKLVGFVPDEELAVLYKEAEAFVFPTLSEGFGLPGLEAMSTECPVLCSDIPVLREVYREAAFFFDPNDPKDICQKIKELLANKELREKLIKQGTNLAKKYSWQKMAKETLDVYRSV